ncbi:predicted protein [Nematostella vectensis]|uniref:Phorbol-ester/DAG-type domain-containing protein n=1 Tax=Nematostella vectensis TaxID=45351 RepID=A7T0A7_NEMVE|nr:predicted protein [Nematostella vectensis]|eukprot:XP_001622713.1 predicted protein [Nematostella vectensis]
MHPVKCAVCLDSVHFGRQSSKCAECDSVCHIKCCPNLPHTCGLPSQFVEHFSEALSDNMDVSLDKSMTRSISQHDLGLAGWMKVPSSCYLEQRRVKRNLAIISGQEHNLAIMTAGKNTTFHDRAEVETCEPCNCIHFTSHSVVYGIGKFYSLDLRQHTVTGE